MALCAQCRREKAQADGLCPSCRLRAHGLADRRYRFTEALRCELRDAYLLPKPARAAAIRKMMVRTGWPHLTFRKEAVRMGIQKKWRAAAVRIQPKPLREWTEMDAHCLFSAERSAIKKWFKRGLFGRVVNGRVSAEAVIRFATRYPHEYDLRRVDQVLYKALLFGGEK